MSNQVNDQRWVKATASAANGNCVEMCGLGGGGVEVRDSKNPGGDHLFFGPDPWRVFLDGVNTGDLVEVDR